MLKGTGSATAIGAATLRAAHQLIDGDEKLLNDPIILKLFGHQLQGYILQHRAYFFETGPMALRAHIALRSRYAEDCLKQAYDNGIRQFIILGAGMDTFAYRQPDWARDIQIVEADHPASQAEKLHRLQQAGIPIPDNVCFVKVDLEADNLPAIFSESGVNLNEPIFMACLGVLIYLSEKAVDNVFHFAGSLPVKSEFVFTASQKRDSEAMSATAQRAAEAGEPWITHFEPAELINRLIQYGFKQVAYLTADEAQQLYFANSKVQLPSPKRNSLVRAVV
jgi:methyltransferase (TIGR00027 family)